MLDEASVLLLAPNGQLPEGDRVWGTGGWMAPERREALDWLTLARLLGWAVHVVHRPADMPAVLPRHARWVIACGNPDDLSVDVVSMMASYVASAPVMVVACAGATGSPIARLAGAARTSELTTGREVRWTGVRSSRAWQCRKPLEAHALDVGPGVEIPATLDGTPCIAMRPGKKGVVATLAFHPSRARDADGCATALLRHLLIFGSRAPVAWLDFDSTMILRMDDAGGAQNVHCRHWSYPKLTEREWTAIAEELGARQARMSIGYIPGWVDDGDVERGELRIAGREVARSGGAVYESPAVTYSQLDGRGSALLHDYESEFRGIQALRAAHLGDVELHGFTHMHPDLRAWAAAPDRYDRTGWFRELGHSPTGSDIGSPHPLSRGTAVFHRRFGTLPTTLIPPGDEWTNDSLGAALDLGIELVSSYYLALRHDGRFCWATHVCAPYLDQPDARWFDSGLPVVGYFHDREPALEGARWISECLDRWQAAGARRFVDFREVAAALGRSLYLENGDSGLRLTVTRTAGPELVRPLPVRTHLP